MLIDFSLSQIEIQSDMGTLMLYEGPPGHALSNQLMACYFSS